MSGMSYADYGKKDNTGKGVSRVAVLLDAIRNGTPIEVSGKGNKVIQFNDPDLEKEMEIAANTLDDSVHNAFADKFSGKRVLKYFYQQGNVSKSQQILLTSIEKTRAFGSTGGSGAGAGSTALFESAAAWFAAVRFNQSDDLPVDSFPSEKKIAAVTAKVSTDKSWSEVKNFLENNQDWVESSNKTANALYDKFKGGNYTWYRGKGTIINALSNAFKRLQESHIVPETGIQAKPFANLNKWTPADLWACDTSCVSAKEMKAFTTFSAFNEFLQQNARSGKLIGISLKQVERNTANLTEVNMGAPKSTAKFNGIYAKSFTSLDVWMYTSGVNLSIQFRDTSGNAGLTWQGEVIGSAAKHGKIGGGVINLMCQQVYGSPLYGNLDNIKSQARSGALNVPILRLSEAHRSNIDGSMNKEGRTNVSEINADIIKEQYERSDPKGQWSFSKYMGLLLVDKLMSGNADQFAQLVYLYATSQSRESAPFFKVS
tara:strand:+ start:393 stop:1850 length:1458 start_codon:yes stop_codon:yes gene_type:complete